MKIAYLLESTDLWGGVKVVFEQAELLADVGHSVKIFSKSGYPDWYPLRIPLIRCGGFHEISPSDADIFIGTYWTTVRDGYKSVGGKLVHLCQGYEAANRELRHLSDEIEQVYSLKIPKLAVSPHLTAYIRDRFSANAHYISQIINRDIFFPAQPRDILFPERPFTILVIGIFEADVKNIPTVLRGISHAITSEQLPIKVVRVSSYPLTTQERDILTPDSYFYRVPYTKMGDIYRSSDLVISMSKKAEGFGLPALEAMASGVPVILSPIPSFMNLDSIQDYASFVDPPMAEVLAEKIIQLYRDSKERRRLRARGLSVASKYTAEAFLDRFSSALRIITGARTC